MIETDSVAGHRPDCSLHKVSTDSCGTIAYLSFLGLVWLVPVVTLDKAVLIGFWTASISVGSVLKDSRLLFCVGDEYRSSQVAVPSGAALMTR